ncbi:Hypothetical_protein [Hexamita inflata]|uniref:Hypothetical_protein n=1 Tax=Hexamita inflata TaxID=28002 RepID=A0AA86R054_9EUKA|nr:Hypothetical protein HINF_LOCUS56869 [Hexamita inflata]
MTLCYITETICHTVCTLKYCEFDKKLNAYCCTSNKKSNWQMWTYISLGILAFLFILIDLWICYRKKNKNKIYKKAVKVQKPEQIKQYVGEREDQNEGDQLL